MDKRFRKQKKSQANKAPEKVNARVKCDCEASLHTLVNNCTNCGRIVCEKEGAGPCFFCGKLVYSYSQRGKFNSEKDIYDQKFNGKQSTPEISEEYFKKRDMLLEYDKNNISQTSVIDDESDYFQYNNSWLSEKERKKLKELSEKRYEQKHASRLNKKLTMDFTGRVFENEDQLEAEYDMSTIANAFASCSEEIKRSYDDLPDAFNILTYTSNVTHNKNREQVTSELTGLRVQDKTYLEILDSGACLSLHQPYASLLVKGIKTIEGRTWYSAHRGRLWIASAAKEPSVDEIKKVENYYSALYNDNVKFPKTYPTGCLLGCITVNDVLSQEEYQKLNLKEENDSPYLFICDDFFELPVKYPLQGKYKIYKLDPTIHKAALNTLEKATKRKL